MVWFTSSSIFQKKVFFNLYTLGFLPAPQPPSAKINVPANSNDPGHLAPECWTGTKEDENFSKCFGVMRWAEGIVYGLYVVFKSLYNRF